MMVILDSNKADMMQNKDTSRDSPAQKAVLETYELLEAILLDLPVLDLLFATRTCKAWESTFSSSQQMRKRLFESDIPGWCLPPLLCSIPTDLPFRIPCPNLRHLHQQQREAQLTLDLPRLLQASRHSRPRPDPRPLSPDLSLRLDRLRPYRPQPEHARRLPHAYNHEGKPRFPGRACQHDCDGMAQSG